MVAGIHAVNHNGESKLDIGQGSIQKSLMMPIWRRNSVLEATDKLRNLMLIASNPDTPESTLDVLAEEESPVLLERVAENVNTSPYTLSKLAFHDNPRVRASVAENAALPESIMWRLCGDVHPDVRLRLAESYVVPRSILQVLADDDNPYVQNRAIKTISRLQQRIIAPSLAFGCC